MLGVDHGAKKTFLVGCFVDNLAEAWYDTGPMHDTYCSVKAYSAEWIAKERTQLEQTEAHRRCWSLYICTSIMLSHTLGAFAALAFRPAPRGLVTCRAFASEAQSTIAYWQDILTHKSTGDPVDTKTSVQTHELKQLLQDAIRVYSASGASPVLPEEITNVFIRVYREILDPSARVNFFSLLARDFGVQGGVVLPCDTLPPSAAG